ncbi:MAG TPA: hypothetical protein VNO24_23470 [Blastocatellia bacterium]|nr:hypothetical protein [Blastocatellia bacterium]
MKRPFLVAARAEHADSADGAAEFPSPEALAKLAYERYVNYGSRRWEDLDEGYRERWRQVVQVLLDSCTRYVERKFSAGRTEAATASGPANG